MKQVSFFVVIVLLCSHLLGCATSYESNTQIDESGFLVISGNFLGTEMNVDDKLIAIDQNTQTYIVDGSRVAKFPISVGSHVISIKRNGVTVFSKSVYLSNAQSVEISVP